MRKPTSIFSSAKSTVFLFCFFLLSILILSGCSDSTTDDLQQTNEGTTNTPVAKPEKTIYEFANGCFALMSTKTGNYLKATGSGYSATSNEKAKAESFFMKPSDLGVYILQDSHGHCLDASIGTDVTSCTEPRASSQWELEKYSNDTFSIKSLNAQMWLSVSSSGRLILAESLNDTCEFSFEPGSNCSEFPESEVNATVNLTNRPVGEKIVGFADPHCHITGDEGFGGKVIWGKIFHPLGITKALPGCETQHGKKGRLDIIETAANGKFGHDTNGWPDFKDWPGPDSPTHQNVYYRWLERAYLGGLRLIVNFAVNNEVLCKIAGQLPGYTCDDMQAVDRQLNYIKKMERYIDAQCGGPGKGWFRIVYSPAEARTVISQGKMAVVLGIEVATIFGAAGETVDKEHIKQQLDYYHDLGVRSIYPIHGFDNAFGGTAMFVPAIYNLGNKIIRKEYLKPCECDTYEKNPELLSEDEVFTFKEVSVLHPIDPKYELLEKVLGIAIPYYPDYKAHCNSKGLTPLGEWFIGELMARNIIIEIDHMSAKMLNGTLDIVEPNDYPVVSSHAAVVEGKGDEASKSIRQMERIRDLGGIVAPILIQGDEGIKDKYIKGPYCKISSRGWANVYKYICNIMGTGNEFYGVPLSTDFNGFATLPSPRFGEKACSGTGEQKDEAPKVSYPFAPHTGTGVIDQLKIGNRIFDINYDGVANYGLIPDFIQEVKNIGLTDDDLSPLFNSAEAYIRMWEKVESR